MSLIRWLFRADAAAPPDAMKLDGTTDGAGNTMLRGRIDDWLAGR